MTNEDIEKLHESLHAHILEALANFEKDTGAKVSKVDYKSGVNEVTIQIAISWGGVVSDKPTKGIA